MDELFRLANREGRAPALDFEGLLTLLERVSQKTFKEGVRKVFHNFGETMTVSWVRKEYHPVRK